MDPSRTKSARFAVVVAKCGQPEPITLWRPAEQDPGFMAAVKQDRVMTVRQEMGGKKEFGVVGFKREKKASYLLFPKPLTEFKERRIVGIRFELARAPEPLGEVVQPGMEPYRRPRRRVPSQELPRSRSRRVEEQPGAVEQRKLYRVTIRFKSVVETVETVEADSRKAARETALKQVRMPDMGRGTVTRKVFRVTGL